MYRERARDRARRRSQRRGRVESGELFPTKRHVTAMAALRAKGPSAIVRAPRGKAAAKTGQARLADPALWKIVRKLVEHPALFDQVAKLSETFSDPAEPPAAAPKTDS